MFLRIVLVSAACLGLGLVFIPKAELAQESAKASEETHEFVIAGADGYGTDECLQQGAQCGHLVADIWCESKGFARSLSFRPASAEDFTGSTGSRPPKPAFVITCSAK